MARPSTTLPEWATTATQPAGTEAWSGQPTRDATAIASLAAQGFLPDEQTDAETLNAWLGLESEWTTWAQREIDNAVNGTSDGGDTTLRDAVARLAAANTFTLDQTIQSNLRLQPDGHTMVRNGSLRPSLDHKGMSTSVLLPASSTITIVNLFAEALLVDVAGHLDVTTLRWDNGSSTSISLVRHLVVFSRAAGATSTPTITAAEVSTSVSLEDSTPTDTLAIVAGTNAINLQATSTLGSDLTHNYIVTYKAIYADLSQ